MHPNPKTYYEDGYWAVVDTGSGHTYYAGPYHSRSTARRVSIRETSRHEWARQHGYHYNARQGCPAVR